MSALIDELRQRAQALSAEDRAQLAEWLLASVEAEPGPDVQNAWGSEVERRLRKLADGTAVLVPSSDVHAQARSLYE